VAKGDLVTLLFCERSIDKYTQGTGQDTDPVHLHMHNLIDAVAFPGFYPFSQPLKEAHADNLVIGKDEGAQIHIKPDEVNLYEENATDFVALAADTKSEISAVRDTLNTHIADYNLHTHILAIAALAGAGGTGTAAPTISQSAPPAAVGDVKATKMKAT